MDEEHVVELQVHAASAAAKEMRQLGELTDVTVLCGGAEFPCHRFVLATGSSYFRALFRSGMEDSKSPTVNLDLLEADAVKTVLDIMYGEAFTLPQDREQLRHLLVAADFLQLQTLFKLCCKKYGTYVSCKSFYDIVSTASHFDSREMMGKVLDFLIPNLIATVSAGDFLLLEFSHVKEIVSVATSRQLPAEVVIDGIMTWAKHDPAERKGRVLELFKIVKWTVISSDYIKKMIEREDIVSSSPGVVQLLKAETKGRLRKASAKDGRKLFFVGDTRGSYTRAQCFDLRSREWSSIFNLPFTLGDRGCFSSVWLNGCVYFIGDSVHGDEVCRNVMKYTPFSPSVVRTYSKMLPHGRRSTCSATVFQGKVYCVFSKFEKESDALSHYLENKPENFPVEVYDPCTNCWETAAPTNNVFYKPTMVEVEDRLFIINPSNRAVEEYHDSQWTVTLAPGEEFDLNGSVQYVFRAPVAAAYQGCFVFGYDDGFFRSYDRRTKEWQKKTCRTKEIVQLWGINLEGKQLPYMLMMNRKGILYQYNPRTCVSSKIPGCLSLVKMYGYFAKLVDHVFNNVITL